jgi:hypothetical protein
MIFAGEKRFAVKHLSKDATRAPNIHLNIIFLPSQHDLRCTVVPCRDVTGHLRVLDARQTEITDLQVAIFVDKNVARLQVAVDNTCRVHIFQATLVTNRVSGESYRRATSVSLAYHDLIEEVLNELLLQGPRSQEAVQISAQKLCDKVAMGRGKLPRCDGQ